MSSEWYRVEVTDRDGQIVAIEPAMLAGRDIGDRERKTIENAMAQLSGFLGLPDFRELYAKEVHAKMVLMEHYSGLETSSAPQTSAAQCDHEPMSPGATLECDSRGALICMHCDTFDRTHARHATSPVDPLQTETRAATSRGAHSTEDAGRSGPSITAELERYKQALYRANGYLMQHGLEPVKLEYKGADAP